jgi:hypothetical protein
MNIGYRLRGDRHWGLMHPSLPAPFSVILLLSSTILASLSSNNVQPSPRILFCPITSISERAGADVIEFHQVANFALFSTLRQPSLVKLHPLGGEPLSPRVFLSPKFLVVWHYSSPK